MTRIISIILLAAIPVINQSAASIVRPSAMAWQIELPATSQGRIVAEYVKAFNTGDDGVMKAFFTKNVAATALEQRPVEARLNVYHEMKSNLGGIEVQRVLETNNSEIVVLVKTRQGEWVKIGFLFEPNAPSKLVALRVEDAEAPPESKSENTAPAAAMTKDQLVAAIERRIAQAVASDEFSGAVIVTRKDSILLQRAYGLASKEYNVANRIDTKFNLGSINKIFTQIAVGQLVEQGKLAFDDKLGKFLPDYPNHEAAEKVTIRQLLDMKSGIGDFFGPEFEAMPKDRIRNIKDYLPLFAAKPLRFEPGTKQQYSNGGYIVLGAIVEKIAGRDYYGYVRENIFKPANMQSTDWYDADVVVPNVASGYTTRGSAGGPRRNNFYTRPAKGSPAGGGYSTAPDLMNFVAALREGKLRIPDFRGNQAAGRVFRGVGIAGGSDGLNCVLEDHEERGYTIIVMSNYDPPSAEKIAGEIRSWLGNLKE